MRCSPALSSGSAYRSKLTLLLLLLSQCLDILKIPYDRDQILIKICRGLHRKYKDERLPTKIFSDVIIRVPLIQDQFFNLTKACTVIGRFGETFTYMGGFPTDGKDMSFWFLGFYTNVDFFVMLSADPPPIKV